LNQPNMQSLLYPTTNYSFRAAKHLQNW